MHPWPYSSCCFMQLPALVGLYRRHAAASSSLCAARAPPPQVASQECKAWHAEQGAKPPALTTTTAATRQASWPGRRACLLHPPQRGAQLFHRGYKAANIAFDHLRLKRALLLNACTAMTNISTVHGAPAACAYRHRGIQAHHQPSSLIPKRQACATPSVSVIVMCRAMQSKREEHGLAELQNQLPSMLASAVGLGTSPSCPCPGA